MKAIVKQNVKMLKDFQYLCYEQNPLIRNSTVKSYMAIINVRRLKWWSLALGPEQKEKKDILNNTRNC